MLTVQAPANPSCSVQYVSVSAAPVGSSAPTSAVSASGAASASAPGASSPASSGTPSSGEAGTSTGGSDSINEAFTAKDKVYFGNIADPGTLSSSETQSILHGDFGQITPENSMKWDASEPSQNQFSYSSAEQTASYAAENGKLLRCHALLWHSQLPTWVPSITDATTLTSVIENHISNVADHF